MEKLTIEFTHESRPAIRDYNTYLAGDYGLYPSVSLIIIEDDENWYESAQRPCFKIADGLIDKIYWDLGEPRNGFIVFH